MRYGFLVAVLGLFLCAGAFFIPIQFVAFCMAWTGGLLFGGGCGVWLMERAFIDGKEVE